MNLCLHTLILLIRIPYTWIVNVENPRYQDNLESMMTDLVTPLVQGPPAWETRIDTAMQGEGDSNEPVLQLVFLLLVSYSPAFSRAASHPDRAATIRMVVARSISFPHTKTCHRSSCLAKLCSCDSTSSTCPAQERFRVMTLAAVSVPQQHRPQDLEAEDTGLHP